MVKFDREYDVSRNNNTGPKRQAERPAHLVYDEVTNSWVDPKPDEHHVPATMDIELQAESAQEVEVAATEPTEPPEVFVEAAEAAQVEELKTVNEVSLEDPVENIVGWSSTNTAVGGNNDSV